jgi:hypothetical protein
VVGVEIWQRIDFLKHFVPSPGSALQYITLHSGKDPAAILHPRYWVHIAILVDCHINSLLRCCLQLTLGLVGSAILAGERDDD